MIVSRRSRRFSGRSAGETCGRPAAGAASTALLVGDCCGGCTEQDGGEAGVLWVVPLPATSTGSVAPTAPIQALASSRTKPDKAGRRHRFTNISDLLSFGPFRRD